MNPFRIPRDTLACLIRVNLKHAARCDKSLGAYNHLRSVWFDRFPGEAW